MLRREAAADGGGPGPAPAGPATAQQHARL